MIAGKKHITSRLKRTVNRAAQLALVLSLMFSGYSG